MAQWGWGCCVAALWCFYGPRDRARVRGRGCDAAHSRGDLDAQRNTPRDEIFLGFKVTALRGEDGCFFGMRDKKTLREGGSPVVCPRRLMGCLVESEA